MLSPPTPAFHIVRPYPYQIIMQKTTLFGKSHDSHTQQTPKPCPSCAKLRAKVTELTQLLADSQSNLQSALEGSDNEMLQQLQGELVSLREKYAVLKKRVQQAEKENDDLFADNTRIEKQLALCRNQLRHYQDAPKQITPPKRSQRSTPEEQRRSPGSDKGREVELFVWQERVRQLQGLGKEQSEEIVRLKEFLRKRNAQQAERHQLLQLIT